MVIFWYSLFADINQHQSSIVLQLQSYCDGTHSFVTCVILIPCAQTHPSAPFNCANSSLGYVLKSLCMITLTFSWPSACGTGLRDRTETLVTVGVFIIWWRTPLPTRPVAPVRMRCISIVTLADDLRKRKKAEGRLILCEDFDDGTQGCKFQP